MKQPSLATANETPRKMGEDKRAGRTTGQMTLESFKERLLSRSPHQFTGSELQAKLDHILVRDKEVIAKEVCGDWRFRYVDGAYDIKAKWVWEALTKAGLLPK